MGGTCAPSMLDLTSQRDAVPWNAQPIWQEEPNASDQLSAQWQGEAPSSGEPWQGAAAAPHEQEASWNDEAANWEDHVAVQTDGYELVDEDYDVAAANEAEFGSAIDTLMQAVEDGSDEGAEVADDWTMPMDTSELVEDDSTTRSQEATTPKAAPSLMATTLKAPPSSPPIT